MHAYNYNEIIPRTLTTYQHKSCLPILFTLNYPEWRYNTKAKNSPRLSFLLEKYFLPQPRTSQTNGRSPVWTRMCDLEKE